MTQQPLRIMGYVVLKGALQKTSEWAVDFNTQNYLHIGEERTEFFLGKLPEIGSSPGWGSQRVSVGSTLIRHKEVQG